MKATRLIHGDCRKELKKMPDKSVDLILTDPPYEYDFGDGWRHEVLFEGFPPAVPKAKPPLCLEGERACPPEDCGGPPGYADYLDAIADPENEQH